MLGVKITAQMVQATPYTKVRISYLGRFTESHKTGMLTSPLLGTATLWARFRFYRVRCGLSHELPFVLTLSLLIRERLPSQIPQQSLA
jgi:hypothetical protein